MGIVGGGGGHCLVANFVFGMYILYFSHAQNINLTNMMSESDEFNNFGNFVTPPGVL